jgi:hypothetical protein
MLAEDSQQTKPQPEDSNFGYRGISGGNARCGEESHH